MNDAAAVTPKSASTPIHYELPVGAIVLLDSILTQPQWYKENPRGGSLIVRAVQASDALPDIPARIQPEKDETQYAYDRRLYKWSDLVYEFDWTGKQREAVKVCVQHFLKQGAFASTKYCVALLCLLGLDDDEE
jgi:hypothetical protein